VKRQHGAGGIKQKVITKKGKRVVAPKRKTTSNEVLKIKKAVRATHTNNIEDMMARKVMAEHGGKLNLVKPLAN